MQIWQLFIVLRYPVTISVTVFSNLTKLTNDLFINIIQINTTLYQTNDATPQWIILNNFVQFQNSNIAN